MATEAELLRQSIEQLTREMRENRRTRGSAPSRPSSPAPSTPSSGEASPQPSNIRPNESGFEFNFNADKIGSGFTELLENMMKGFDEFKQNIENSFGSILAEVLQVREALEKANVQLFKQAGAFSELKTTYSQFAPFARSIGLSYMEAATALSTLTQKVPGFLDLSEQQRLVIAKQTGALERLGVTAAESAASFSSLLKSFGMTPEKATKAQEDLYKFANALKAPPNIIMRDFSTAAPKLAMFGDKAIDVFKNSQIFVQKFGISLDSILGQIDKFDTFETAAEAAGKLNIALGKDFFDTQELLFTTGDPSKRIEMISKKLKDIKRETGQSFDEMNVFLRKDLTSTLGLQADEIRRLEKLSEVELRNVQERVKSGKSITESIEQSAKKTLTLDERLNAMKERLLLAFLPLIQQLIPIVQQAEKYITVFVNFITNLQKQYPGFLKIATGIASAFAAYKALSPVTDVLGKLKDGIMSFIPFGSQLSGFVLPGIGAAIAGFAAKYGGNAVEQMMNIKLGDKDDSTPIHKLLGISPQQIKAFQKDLDNMTGFIYDGLKKVFMDIIGFSEGDTIAILSSVQSTFAEAFGVFEEQFGKLKNIFFSFFSGFGESMKAQADDSANPFVKILKSVLGGLNKAIETFKKEFSGEEGTKGEITGLLGEIKDTFGKLKDEMLKEFGGFAGAIFGGAGGEPSMLDSILNNNFVKNFGKEFLNAIGGLFTGISEITKLVTGNIDLAVVGAKFKTFFSDFVGAMTGSVGFFDSLKTVDVARIGAGASGIASLAQNLGNVTNLKPLDPLFVNSFDRLAEAIKNLNMQLDQLSLKKENLSLLTAVPQENVTRLAELVNSVERYAKAVGDLNKASTEQDKMIQVVNAIGRMAGTLKIDSEQMGEVIGDKVAAALGRRFAGG